MAAIEAYRDDCRTAADVMAHAAAVREKRRLAFGQLKAAPIRQPEPIIKTMTVAPPVSDMIVLVAAHYRVNPGDLLEAVNTLKTNTPIKRSGYQGITIRDIQKAVARVAALSFDEMIGPRRSSELVRARHVAIALCKRLTPWRSFPDIGRKFGNRDHTTCLYAAQKLQPLLTFVEPMMANDASVAAWAKAMLEHYDEIIGKH